MMYRVLLAEDEPAAAENIDDIIRLYCPGFRLEGTGENGRDALVLAGKLRPDLLLTDIRMPVMDGLELIKRLSGECPEITSIIISGYEDFDYARTALRYGAVDYLLKPIAPATLQAALENTVPLLEEARRRRLDALKLTPDEEQRLSYYIKEGIPEKIRQMAEALFTAWSEEGKADQEIHERAGLLFGKIREGRPGWFDVDEAALEAMLEHAFRADKAAEKTENLLGILDDILPGDFTATGKVDTPEFFSFVTEYLDAHLSTPVTLTSLCEHFGISQVYMSRIFRKYSGMSFVNYLTRIRIKQAQQLLAKGGMLIRDVADLTGFCDPYYFSKVFRSVTGKSPSEYGR
jgi:two-component system response regulator YesN